MESQDFDAWKIDLPGGGFIQKPGSELRPVSDEFASAEERQMLMAKLDELLEKRAAKESELQNLLTEENSLIRTLKNVNDALDYQGTELTWMTETLRAERNKMVARVQEKKAHLVDLRETLPCVEREERKTSSYKIIAKESRDLRKRISESLEEKKVLLKKIEDLEWHEKLSKKRCKIILEEEQRFWMKISERVQWMAENGQLSAVEPGDESQQAVKVEEQVEQDQAGSKDALAEKNPAESDNNSVHLLADKDEELAKRDKDSDVKDSEGEDQASSQKTESKDVQAEENPAESDKKSVHLSADANRSNMDEELAKQDQDSDAKQEERHEEDQASSQKNKNCTEMLRDETSKTGSTSPQVNYTQIKADKPLKISPASQSKGKSKKKEESKKKKEKTKKSKKTKDDKQKKVLYAGMQFKDSLEMDQPGGVWAETCSTTSTQSVESAPVPPTVVTVQAEIHHPKTKHEGERMRRSLRPSNKQIAAQLASNREQLKLAEQIEIIEQQEFQEEGEKEQEGKDEEEGEEEPTVVTVQAEIHNPTTKHEGESMRRSLRPSNKQIAAQLASNREQLKLAEQIEIIEQQEFQEEGEEEQEGKDGEEGEDSEEDYTVEGQIEDVVTFEFEEDLEVEEESSKKRGCFSFLRNLFKRFKFGSKKTPPPQKKSRAARRKEMAAWSETLHAPTELITGEVLVAHQTV